MNQIVDTCYKSQVRDCELPSREHSRACNFEGEMCWDHFHIHTEDSGPSGLDTNHLKAELQAGRPIVSTLQWKSTLTNHEFIIAGYTHLGKQFELIVFDPLQVDTVVMTLPEYSGNDQDHTHIDDLYQLKLQ